MDDFGSLGRSWIAGYEVLWFHCTIITFVFHRYEKPRHEPVSVLLLDTSSQPEKL